MLQSIGNTITGLTPDSDEVIEISRKKRIREPYPGFTIFGNGKETRNGGKSMDILDICQQLNTGEMRLMQFFRDEVESNKAHREDNPNRVVPTNSGSMTTYLKIALKKNFPHMECLGILKRMYRGVYMMNPGLFIPPSNVANITRIWNDIKSKECAETGTAAKEEIFSTQQLGRN